MEYESLDIFFEKLVTCYENICEHIFRNDLELLRIGLGELQDYSRIINIFYSHVTREELKELLHLLSEQLTSKCIEIDNLVSNCTNLSLYNLPNVLNDSNDPPLIGRPRYDLSYNQIKTLRSCGLSWKRISEALNISVRTLSRYKTSLLFDENAHSVTDDELDSVIQEILSRTPNAGEVYIIGSIKSRNIKVSRSRIRERLHILNPLRISLRRTNTISRRVYKVKGPNYLWHMDSNHKLTAFRFVFHGCIDGYSRLIVYLKCLTDNTTDSVLTLFKESVGIYGLPVRVRGDHGTENISVAEFMISQRGMNKGSYITGRSVHNQRIERLWAEVNRVVSKHYKELFISMEDDGLLDELNEVDLFALRYVYLPRIQNSLEEFVNQWNHHHLSTMHGYSPLQLWITGLAGNNDDMMTEDEFYLENPEEYGIDGDESVNIETNNNIVVPLPDQQLLQIEQQLKNIVPDPLSDDQMNGISFYCAIRNFIHTLL